jgi:hypothetical protein
MVDTPTPNLSPELEKKAKDRRDEAREKKALWALDFKECYFFSAPHRQREIFSTTKPAAARRNDAPELQTSLAFDLVGEFVTEIVNTFMPESQPWVQQGPGMFIKPDVWKQVAEIAKANDAAIFDAIKSSNFYAEIPKAYDPDLAIGTAAIWIDQPRPDQAIQCSAVPLRELECNLGPNGEIDDRFAVRWARNCHVSAILPGVTLPADVQKLIDDKPNDVTCITRGFWRKWEEKDECWQYIALVGDKLVDAKEIKGEGSCPLIITRFNPSADWVWGIGFLMKGLPDLRQVDELEDLKIVGIARNTSPPMGYPDDSFANIAQGLEEGMGYPVRPGTTDHSVIRLSPEINMDPANYQTKDKEHQLRRLAYVDFPEQSGDTPPTAAQWMDQLARAQRRIGTPGMSFWREGPMAYYLRFKYLLERNGAIKPLQVDGKMVSARPLNPAQRAAEQQEIAMAAQFMQFVGQAFPEEAKLAIDGAKSIAAIREIMRVKMIVMRKPEEMKAALAQITPLIKQHFAPGAPQQPGQEQPAPPPGPMQ